MKIIGINGSPAVDGNTAFLLHRVLQAAAGLGADTRILHVAPLVSGVEGSPFCDVCSNPCHGNCFKGTALEVAYEDLCKADAIVLGSPVYFGTVSAQLKAFFDKTRLLRTRKALYNKVGAAVSVAASRFGGQETTLRALHDIMLVHGMLIVGDGHIDSDCGHHGVCAQRPAMEDTVALARADLLARRLVEVCGVTAALRSP